MRSKKYAGILTGLFLATLGVLLLLTSTHKEWFPCDFWDLAWPIAVIYLGLGWGDSNRVTLANIGITALGVYLLLSNLGAISFSFSWPVLLSFVLIIVGLSSILRPFFDKKD